MKLEISRQFFEKYINVKFMENRPLGAKLFHADRREDGLTDGHDEANSRFSQCCEKRLNSEDLPYRRQQCWPPASLSQKRILDPCAPLPKKNAGPLRPSLKKTTYTPRLKWWAEHAVVRISKNRQHIRWVLKKNLVCLVSFPICKQLLVPFWHQAQESFTMPTLQGTPSSCISNTDSNVTLHAHYLRICTPVPGNSLVSLEISQVCFLFFKMIVKLVNVEMNV